VQYYPSSKSIHQAKYHSSNRMFATPPDETKR